MTIVATIGIGTAETTGTEATTVDVQRNATTAATAVAGRDRTAESGTSAITIGGARSGIFIGI